MDIVYHPILALLQLGIAGYNCFLSKFANFEIGVPKVTPPPHFFRPSSPYSARAAYA